MVARVQMIHVNTRHAFPWILTLPLREIRRHAREVLTNLRRAIKRSTRES